MYNSSEIKKIVTKIEPYKIFYHTDFYRPSLIVLTTIIGMVLAIMLTKQSKRGILVVGLFTVRMFMIFHDCCHNSFFHVTEEQHNSGERGFNKIVADCIEPFCLQTEEGWRTSHQYHHKVHGNLDLFDSSRTVITKEQYDSLSITLKVLYRIFRSPLIFFVVAPIYTFWACRLNSMTYILKYVLLFALIYMYGSSALCKRFILGQLLGAIIGTMLFHLQHQVNEGYWKRATANANANKMEWSRRQLHGASMLKVPWVLEWVTVGIQYHHIHHMTPRIPCYNLKPCHDTLEQNDKSIWDKITVVSYTQALKSLFHTLYHEETEQYISFPLARFFGLQH